MREERGKPEYPSAPRLSSTGAVAEEAALLVWVIQMHPWGALALIGSVLVRRHRTGAGHQPLWFLLTSPGALWSGRHCRSEPLPAGIAMGTEISAVAASLGQTSHALLS